MRPIYLIAALFLAACGNAEASSSADSKAKAGATEKAEKKIAKPYPRDLVAVAEVASVPQQVVVTGTVQPFDRADIVPDISGKVLEVLVDRGSVVAAGDPLVRLDTRNAALSEKEARANLTAQKSQLRLADENCRRSKELLEKGAITKSEYDRDMTACAQARAAVNAASARVGMADKAIDDGVVRAPFGGTVAERWISVGEWASPNGRLFTLVDDHELRADLSLSELVAVHAKVGAPVTIVPVSDRTTSINAAITRVGVEVDPRTRSLLTEVVLPKDAGLRAGTFVEGRIGIGAVDLPVVPATALSKRGATQRLFVVVGDKLEERVVQVGASVGERISIVRGIEPGESFATVANDEAVDGALVK